MKRVLIILSALSLWVTSAAQTAANNPKHQFIEAKVKDSELLKMATGKEFSIPQLRVYDAQGRQMADFSDDFEEETFIESLNKVLQSPAPIPGKPGLKKELNVIVDARNKQLKELLPVDFTIVEYWAEWCEPCQQQLTLLHEALNSHATMTINVLHVQADPTKLPGVKVIPEK